MSLSGSMKRYTVLQLARAFGRLALHRPCVLRADVSPLLPRTRWLTTNPVARQPAPEVADEEEPPKQKRKPRDTRPTYTKAEDDAIIAHRLQGLSWEEVRRRSGLRHRTALGLRMRWQAYLQHLVPPENRYFLMPLTQGETATLRELRQASKSWAEILSHFPDRAPDTIRRASRELFGMPKQYRVRKPWLKTDLQKLLDMKWRQGYTTDELLRVFPERSRMAITTASRKFSKGASSKGPTKSWYVDEEDQVILRGKVSSV